MIVAYCSEANLPKSILIHLIPFQYRLPDSRIFDLCRLLNSIAAPFLVPTKQVWLISLIPSYLVSAKAD